MNGTTSTLELINTGVELAGSGEKGPARRAFLTALNIDPNNETAVLWLAYLSDNPQKAVEILEGFLASHPNSSQALAYLTQARSKCQELEQLVVGSRTFDSWTRTSRSVAGNVRSVPFLGEYLLRQGVISEQQLDMVLRRHRDLASRGTHKLVGQVMVELGYISQNQLETWLQQQNYDYSDRFRD